MKRGHMEERDDFLGAALRSLEVPEHRPEFYAELSRRLADERTADRARTELRRARRPRIGWAVRAAGIAAAAAIVAAAVGLPRLDEERRPRVAIEEATAAEIQAKVAAALARLEVLSGDLVYDGSEPNDVARWAFTLTARGDFRLTTLNDHEDFVYEDISYDASTGEQRALARGDAGGAMAATITTGLAPGRPDPAPFDWLLPRDFGAVVRALLAADDPRVTEVRYEGRPAWRLDIPVTPNALTVEFGASGDLFEITVDQESGMPVRVTETLNGNFVREIRIEKLATDEPPDADEFTIEFPSDARVTRRDEGFERRSLEQVEAFVGYDPLVPARFPEGYELTEIAVAREGFPTGTEGGNPPSGNIVSLSYRRGLDQFLVTTRLRGRDCPQLGEPPCSPGLTTIWSDPLATGEGFRDDPERITLSNGSLAGVDAELLIVPRNVPHIWALTDDLVVTVSGDLSRTELIAVAESVR